jgi:hypothetical protein
MVQLLGSAMDSVSKTELKHRPQLLQETQHFCRWRQEEVAKDCPVWAANFLFNNVFLTSSH